MYFHMFTKIAARTAPVITFRACVWLLTCVRSMVFLKLGERVKRFSTHLTEVAVIFFMSPLIGLQ